MIRSRLRVVLCLTAFVLFIYVLHPNRQQIERIPTSNHVPKSQDAPAPRPQSPPESPPTQPDRFDWKQVPTRYPVTSLIPLPTATSKKIPKIQAKFAAETSEQKKERLNRREAVRSNFTHAWTGYKKYAWLKDEVRPLTAGGFDPFGGWAATLVDALDTLWIMGMRKEFDEAVEAIDKIDFSTCTLNEINVFETTIRYLAGFLASYDLSGGKYPSLLRKAEELGTMLYKAFDTPNRMPITRWKFKDARNDMPQVAPDWILVAEIGSLTLEFTRLSQVTGDMKYYDAVQRVMNVFEDDQSKSNLPGMWPVVVNPRDKNFANASNSFTIGGMADSAYEYLPKQHLLLGGASNQYRNMYEDALSAMKRNIFYRPMTKDGRDILLAGKVESDGRTALDELKPDPEAQHLGCFAGGMVSIAAKIFEGEQDLQVGKRLVEGCLWGYEGMEGGIMPEIIQTLPCTDTACKWDEKKWVLAMNELHGTVDLESAEAKRKFLGLPHGIMQANDRRYILRPEAIESIFILYRITGDRSLQDRAWKMFNTIISRTKTDVAHAALDDCTISDPPKSDRMESFWLAETLKYFYLIFSEPDLISLDEYVLNTEAHPLKRPS